MQLQMQKPPIIQHATPPSSAVIIGTRIKQRIKDTMVANDTETTAAVIDQYLLEMGISSKDRRLRCGVDDTATI